jgi:hypothetical protein
MRFADVPGTARLYRQAATDLERLQREEHQARPAAFVHQRTRKNTLCPMPLAFSPQVTDLEPLAELHALTV